ncbi:hypothetical protein [Halolamina sp. C58]|uniref:hypothetical protein n=1 Tax=Halolamina sp. C58 TaxID=3421640 RepID=UPI003EBAA930
MRQIRNGDIVWSDDVYKSGDSGRPLLVVGNAEMADHGMQFVCVALTSRTYHEHSIAIGEDEYEGAPLPLESHAPLGVPDALPGARPALRDHSHCRETARDYPRRERLSRTRSVAHGREKTGERVFDGAVRGSVGTV